jgi:hypothetical protein
MALSDIFSMFSPKKRKAEKAREELMSNAEKALRMKQEAGPQTSIPEHQTAHGGMNPKTTNEDHIPAREGFNTPELKRSRVARSGDAS